MTLFIAFVKQRPLEVQYSLTGDSFEMKVSFREQTRVLAQSHLYIEGIKG